MGSNNDFWLIDSNSVGVIRFYKDKHPPEKSINYILIEEGIIIGIYGEKSSIDEN